MNPLDPDTLDPLVLALRFGAALGLGVLLGLERERSKTPAGFAGVRTFGLFAVTGAVAAFLDAALDRPWLALGLFAAVAALVVVSYAVSARRGELGITTEVSALLAFLMGYLCVAGHPMLAAGLAVASGGVLALKEWLHRLAGRIEPADVEATLKFAIVSIIVLPLVPNESFGPAPLDVVNPYKIWLMVVLISGLNFASYVLVKTVGAEHGIGLTGLLGGLVSSTAVTLGFAQRSREAPAQAAALGLGILVAWTVMFARVVVLVGAVAPGLAPRVAAAMAALGLPCLAISWLLWRRRRAKETASVRAGANPFELGQAIRFGVIFGAITFVAKAAQVYLGDAGLYLAGAIAGLTDVDAIALSMAQLAVAMPASAEAAVRTIVIAVASNTLVKAGIAVFLGAPGLRRVVLAATGVILVAALATTLVP
ncbi:MAG: MgtC/SapB family protein [Deltaproteobacteria bacterium]|nr:MgtC/SapB family protein [Deltaproteobacteria bacterium]